MNCRTMVRSYAPAVVGTRLTVLVGIGQADILKLKAASYYTIAVSIWIALAPVQLLTTTDSKFTAP